MSKLINYYDKIPKVVEEKHNDIDIHPNSRILIVGKSGSMKTNLMMNLLKNIGFDTLTLCCKDLEEPLYSKYLIPQVQKLEKKTKEHILDYMTEPSELKDVDEFDPQKLNVIIFDDQVITPNQQNICSLFMRGRKKGCLSSYITQSFFDCPKFIRKNLDYIMIKSLSSVKDMKRILSEFNSNDIEPEKLVEIHKRAINQDPKSFLLIDLKTNNPNKKYRIDFDKYIPIE
jgi:hypothetical protein